MSEKLSERMRRLIGNPWPDEVADLEAKLDTLIGLFGDHDFTPTVEQAVEIWNIMRNREIALEAKLEAMERKCPRPDEHGDMDVSAMMTFCEEVIALAAAQQEKEE